MKIELTISQLEYLLDQQKRIVLDRLKGQTSHWNGDSTKGVSQCVNINETVFMDFGMKASYPEDVEVLKRYLPKPNS